LYEFSVGMIIVLYVVIIENRIDPCSYLATDCKVTSITVKGSKPRNQGYFFSSSLTEWLLQRFQNGSEAYPASYTMGSADFSHGGKEAGA
jgi:hypothetical protein